MMSFLRTRRRKALVASNVKQYAAVFKTRIPKETLAREEVIELWMLELQALATTYDILQGWEFYPEIPMPSLSRKFPRIVPVPPTKLSLTLKIRKAQYVKFVRRTDYITYPSFDPNFRFTNKTFGLYKKRDEITQNFFVRKSPLT